MAFYSTNDVSITGIAACVPKKVVRNSDYPYVSGKKLQMLIKTIGIEEKRHADEGTTTTDLCKSAADRLINELGWGREEIGVVVFVTQSADYYLPSSAILLQHRLGLPTGCIALEVNMGCSGYVYGLSVLSSMMKASESKKGLLLCGDVSTITCSMEDKSTYPLFGDAGTATAMQLGASAPTYFDLNSDATNHEAIHIPHGGARNKLSAKSFESREIEPGIHRAPLHLSLNGLDVFNFSVTEVPPAIKKFMDQTNADASSIDYFVMHQANRLMNETIRKKLGFQEGQCPYSLSDFGNTSSASIPLTMVVRLQQQLQSATCTSLLAGFGVGLSWASALVSTNRLTIPDLIEYE